MYILTLVIPAKNEAPYIQDALRRLSKTLSDLTIPWKIIVANNGSTDDTEQKIQELIAVDHKFQETVSVINCPQTGKGAAIRFVANHIQGDMETVFGFIDADLSADPDAIPGMIDRIINQQADLVIASRLLVTKTTNRGLLRTLSSKGFNFVTNLLLKLRVADAQCGLKIMNQKGVELLKTCKETGWFLDIEFLAKVRQDGLRVVEIPVPWTEFRYPDRKSHISHFRDGIQAIKAIIRIKQSC
ncbi:glycosyltransferase family 2 protein [Patescibacteria group bacterium]|nr:glycosyltransferase family 2 protein [Patescibacteria group bacterium]